MDPPPAITGFKAQMREGNTSDNGRGAETSMCEFKGQQYEMNGKVITDHGNGQEYIVAHGGRRTNICLTSTALRFQKMGKLKQERELN